MQENSDIVANVAASIEKKEDNLIRLSSGVVLRAKKVPSLALMDLSTRFTQPIVPRVKNEDRGRVEENPNDPTYVAEMKRYELNLSNATFDLMIVLGTEFVSSNKNVIPIENDSWLEMVDSIGIKIDFDNISTYKRYLLWVKYVAVSSDEDSELIMKKIGSMSGVLQEDVEKEADKFRGNS